MRRWGVSSYAVRQLGGKALKQQLSLGYSVDSQRPVLLDSFPGTAEQRAPFELAGLPFERGGPRVEDGRRPKPLAEHEPGGYAAERETETETGDEGQDRHEGEGP